MTIVERVEAAVADWKDHPDAANVAPALSRDIDARLSCAGEAAG